jgi:hypothetical protein
LPRDSAGQVARRRQTSCPQYPARFVRREPLLALLLFLLDPDGDAFRGVRRERLLLDGVVERRLDSGEIAVPDRLRIEKRLV